MKSASSAEDEQWHRMNMLKTWETMPGLVVALLTCVDTIASLRRVFRRNHVLVRRWPAQDCATTS